EQEPAIAARLTGALWWFWYYSGRYSDGLYWCTVALERSAGLEASQARAKCAVGGAMLALYRANIEQARQFCEASIEMARPVDAQEQQTLAYNILGSLERTQGRYPAARERYEMSLALARAENAPWLIALALGNLGIMAFHQNDVPTAAAFLAESLALFRAL